MKRKFVLVAMGIIAVVGALLAQGVDAVSQDYSYVFESLATLGTVGGIVTILTEMLINGLQVDKKFWKIVISWVVGIGLAFFGWGFGLGFLDGLIWWEVILAGVASGMISNSLFDTGIVTWLFGLFTGKKG